AAPEPRGELRSLVCAAAEGVARPRVCRRETRIRCRGSRETYANLSSIKSEASRIHGGLIRDAPPPGRPKRHPDHIPAIPARGPDPPRGSTLERMVLKSGR